MRSLFYIALVLGLLASCGSQKSRRTGTQSSAKQGGPYHTEKQKEEKNKKGQKAGEESGEEGKNGVGGRNEGNDKLKKDDELKKDEEEDEEDSKEQSEEERQKKEEEKGKREEEQKRLEEEQLRRREEEERKRKAAEEECKQREEEERKRKEDEERKRREEQLRRDIEALNQKIEDKAKDLISKVPDPASQENLHKDIRSVEAYPTIVNTIKWKIRGWAYAGQMDEIIDLAQQRRELEEKLDLAQRMALRLERVKAALPPARQLTFPQEIDEIKTDPKKAKDQLIVYRDQQEQVKQVAPASFSFDDEVFLANAKEMLQIIALIEQERQTKGSA